MFNLSLSLSKISKTKLTRQINFILPPNRNTLLWQPWHRFSHDPLILEKMEFLEIFKSRWRRHDLWSYKWIRKKPVTPTAGTTWVHMTVITVINFSNFTKKPWQKEQNVFQGTSEEIHSVNSYLLGVLYYVRFTDKYKCGNWCHGKKPHSVRRWNRNGKGK